MARYTLELLLPNEAGVVLGDILALREKPVLEVRPTVVLSMNFVVLVSGNAHSEAVIR